MALASGVWYGIITYLAFQVGDDWDALAARIGGASRTVGWTSLAVVTLAAALWYGRRVLRRRRADA
jgi:membrane protein DedA with SNARE-associated domain